MTTTQLLAALTADLLTHGDALIYVSAGPGGLSLRWDHATRIAKFPEPRKVRALYILARHDDILEPTREFLPIPPAL